MSGQSALDLLLVLAVVVVAFRSIHAPALFTGIVLYVVWGVILALVWVRLEAPDLAIAEAAIGAGITGAMLLDAARQFGEQRSPLRPLHQLKRLSAAAGALAGVAILAGILVTLGDRRSGLARVVAERIPESGVEHPVTAVLLNFRSYDTWLEMGVLLVAALGVLALRGSDQAADEEKFATKPRGVAKGAAAILAPVGCLVAGYLLWRGSHAPGGAFQAGAVLGAIAVLFALIGRSPLISLPGWGRRAALAAGFLLFLAAGLSGFVGGGAFLEFPSNWAGTLILLIESAVALSIAVTLALLFVVAREAEGDRGVGSG